jgi:hypothetical protein
MTNLTRHVAVEASINIVPDCVVQSDRHGNTRLAFQVAADHLGVPVSSH